MSEETKETTETKEEMVELTQSEFDQLTANSQKNGYEDGKKAGVEMQLKELKRAFSEKGIETDGIKDFATLYAKVLDHDTTQYRSQLDGTTQEIETKYQTLIEQEKADKLKLQKLLEETELSYKEKLENKASEITKYRAEQDVTRTIDAWQRNIPEHIKSQGEDAITNFIKVENDKDRILFNSLYSVNYTDENIQVVTDKRTNEIIKDKLQRPESLDNILNSFAKSYNLNFREVKPGQREVNGDVQTKNYTSLSIDKFNELMTQKGIKRSDLAYVTEYNAWKDANK